LRHTRDRQRIAIRVRIIRQHVDRDRGLVLGEIHIVGLGHRRLVFRARRHVNRHDGDRAVGVASFTLNVKPSGPV